MFNFNSIYQSSKGKESSYARLWLYDQHFCAVTTTDPFSPRMSNWRPDRHLLLGRVLSEGGPGSWTPGSRAANGLAAPGFGGVRGRGPGGDILGDPGRRVPVGEMASCPKAKSSSWSAPAPAGSSGPTLGCRGCWGLWWAGTISRCWSHYTYIPVSPIIQWCCDLVLVFVPSHNYCIMVGYTVWISSFLLL